MARHKTSFLGRGWAFPVRLTSDGEIATVAEEEDVQQAIRIILGTARGERVMRVSFGSGLRNLMFEPINTTTISLVKHHVEEALIVWEPRIDNVSVTVTSEAPLGRLLLDVHYRVRSSNIFYNLVYPFYLLEGERT